MPGAITNFLSGVLGGVKQGSRLYEPQRMNSAMLFIEDIDGTSGGSTLGLALANFSLPKVQTQTTTIPYLNEFRKYAGATMYEGIQASFHDYVDRATLATLWNWKLKVHNPITGRKGYKSAYAKDGRIEMMPPQGEEGDRSLLGAGKVVIYEIKGIWIAMMDPGDIDMGSDEPVRINVQFEIDKAYPRMSTLPAT